MDLIVGGESSLSTKDHDSQANQWEFKSCVVCNKITSFPERNYLFLSVHFNEIFHSFSLKVRNGYFLREV